MDARQLRYFVAIADHGSFSRAAMILNIAQPALSLHVRNLELDLGAKLLHRGPKGVVPTEVGMILLRNARLILNQFAVAEEEIRGLDKEPAGEVRLGLPGTIGEILSVPLISAVHERYPKIRLRIAEAMSGFVLEWLRETRIDLAVIYGAVSDQGLGSSCLAEEELVLFGPLRLASPPPDLMVLPPAGHPVEFRDVLGLPLILPGESHGLRSLLERHVSHTELSFSPKIEVDSYGSIKELVRRGIGYSILPANAVASDMIAGYVLGWPLMNPSPKRPVHIAHPVDRPASAAVMAVRELIVEVLQQLILTKSWVGASLPPTPLGPKSAK